MSFSSVRAAAVQMTSGADLDANLARAESLITEAARGGARVVVLPENFALFGIDDARRFALAEPPGEGPVQRFLAEQAARHELWLLGGTLPVRSEDLRARAAALFYGPDGALVGRYDKIHLFDVDVPNSQGERYRESAATAPGHAPGCFATEFGALGVAVCYDLRFPSLFHRLGLQAPLLIAVPAAFTVPTGRAHWQVLLRARAIESLCYVVAAAQCGRHYNGRSSYGHSMIVGPWGEVLAERPEGEGVVLADLDLNGIAAIRRSFPVLDHRREL